MSITLSAVKVHKSAANIFELPHTSQTADYKLLKMK